MAAARRNCYPRFGKLAQIISSAGISHPAHHCEICRSAIPDHDPAGEGWPSGPCAISVLEENHVLGKRDKRAEQIDASGTTSQQAGQIA